MKSIIDYTNLLKSFFAQKQALSDEVVTRAKLTAHNLCVPKNEVGYSTTVNNVSFLVNSDYSITVNAPNGVSTATTLRASNTYNLPNGKYIVSGAPSESIENKQYLWIGVRNSADTGWDAAYKISAGAEQTITVNNSKYVQIEIELSENSGVAISNMIFKPMIRDEKDSDPTYQPYAMTNRELTKSVLQFSSVACAATTGNFATISNSDITADHVVVDCTFANPSAITSDVTWTSSNGSLVLNGTCNSATTATITLARKGN